MDIRKRFLDYFKKAGHLILPSANLIPDNDPSVLLTTAGMQQFKPYYLGTRKPPKSRIATVQKCFRTSDIDCVGYTDKHLTFFEMLGNFSFGDYFKKEAISFALDFVLKELKIPQEKIIVAVFEGDRDIPADEESIKHWENNGVDPDKIYKFGKEENFWGPAGDTGPCGPCTEIYYDFGKEYGCGKKGCDPSCDCARYSEIWNLVFTQYNYDGKKYTELPKKNIDTGMGLERIEAVLEETASVFKTAVFEKITGKIGEISGKKLTLAGDKGHNEEINTAIRIIADHIRAIYFLISDGVTPSNEGRGYILRRIIRRTIRFGRMIGIKDYFLNDIGKVVIGQYGDAYPELSEKKDFSFRLVSEEEKRFTTTLKEGSKVLNQIIEDVKSKGGDHIDPGDAFRLYDTFGFPVELTTEILNENKLGLEIEKFDLYLKGHSKKSKKGSSFDKKIDGSFQAYSKMAKDIEVEFVGYSKDSIKTTVIKILKNVDGGLAEEASGISAGEEGEIILKETPFYAERGGQVGDSGTVIAPGGTFRVDDCRVPVEGIYTHKGAAFEGEIKIGDEVEARVNKIKRGDISRNHTSTHILQWALRTVFGDEIKQSGSRVSNESFRFDYSFYSVPSEEKLAKVERLINEKIQDNDTVRCFETTREYAEEIGAVALFDEKYGKFVRVVEIDGYSRELCGGIHVKRTGDIGIFKIISDINIGANLRRIEASTGMHAYEYLNKKEKIVKAVSGTLEVEENKIINALNGLKDNMQAAEEEMGLMRVMIAKKEILDSSGYKQDSSGMSNVIAYDLSGKKFNLNINIKNMGIIGDEIKSHFKDKNTFIILGNIYGGKPVMTLQSTKDLIAKGIDCGKLAKEVGKILKGGGGGRPDFAQLGGSDPGTMPDAIDFAGKQVTAILNK